MRKTTVLNQGYRDTFSLVMIIGFLLLSILKTADIVTSGSVFTFQSVALFSTIIILGMIVYLLFHTRLEMKVGKKKVTVKIAPFGLTKFKFRRDKVEEVNFFKADNITKSSGLFIHFGNQERIFNFGGKYGMSVRLKDGRKFTFFSKQLYSQEEEIKSLLA